MGSPVPQTSRVYTEKHNFDYSTDKVALTNVDAIHLGIPVRVANLPLSSSYATAQQRNNLQSAELAHVGLIVGEV